MALGFFKNIPMIFITLWQKFRFERQLDSPKVLISLFLNNLIKKLLQMWCSSKREKLFGVVCQDQVGSTACQANVKKLANQDFRYDNSLYKLELVQRIIWSMWSGQSWTWYSCPELTLKSSLVCTPKKIPLYRQSSTYTLL